MTLHEIAHQLFDLTDGHISGRYFSEYELAKGMTRTFESGALNAAFSIVHLPDGDWYCEVSRTVGPDGTNLKDGYDYYIPETRGDEAVMINCYGLQSISDGLRDIRIEREREASAASAGYQHKSGLVTIG